jgi:hypothetical protein
MTSRWTFSEEKEMLYIFVCAVKMQKRCSCGLDIKIGAGLVHRKNATKMLDYFRKEKSSFWKK